MNAERFDSTLISLLVNASKNFRNLTAMLVAADRSDEVNEPNLAFFLRYVANNVDPKTINTKFLFTGSRCYGKPTEKSDVDWVIVCDKPTERSLTEMANMIATAYGEETTDANYYGHGQSTIALRMGPLNLILVRTELQWRVWRQGTMNLIRMRKDSDFGREFAINHFAAIMNTLISRHNLAGHSTHRREKLKREPFRFYHITQRTADEMDQLYAIEIREHLYVALRTHAVMPQFADWLRNDMGWNNEQVRQILELTPVS